jgi:long-chain acyl-CoA synthetase
MSSSTKTAPLYPIISDIPPFTLEVPGVKVVEGESIPRRNSRYVEKLLSQPEEGVATVFDIVTRAARVFSNARAVGTRKLIKTHIETKKVTKVIDGREQQVDKKWTYFELSGYAYLSFAEYEQQVLQIGAGLRNLGLVKDDRLFLFAATRYVRGATVVARNSRYCVVHDGL